MTLAIPLQDAKLWALRAKAGLEPIFHHVLKSALTALLKEGVALQGKAPRTTHCVSNAKYESATASTLVA